MNREDKEKLHKLIQKELEEKLEKWEEPLLEKLKDEWNENDLMTMRRLNAQANL
jgi:hypothetical protein